MKFDVVNKYTLLSFSQADYNGNPIDIISEFGRSCSITDYAVLLGGSSEGGKGIWCTSTFHERGNVYAFYFNGDIAYVSQYRRDIGLRPVLPFTNIKDLVLIEDAGDNPIFEVEYGEYPQNVVEGSLAIKLDEELLAGRLNKTSKVYHVNLQRKKDDPNEFITDEYIEYEYNGRKFIKAKNMHKEYCFVAGKQCDSGEEVWVEVLPIKWIVDMDAKLMISKSLITSGVKYYSNEENAPFTKSEMFIFLNKYFAEDIIPSIIQNKKYTELDEVLYRVEAMKKEAELKKSIMESEVKIGLNKLKEALTILRNTYYDDAPKIEVSEQTIFATKNDHLIILPVVRGILKYLDLSSVSFDNVDCRDMDFRGCNLGILFRPQKVYGKNLSGCNFEKVYFSIKTNFTGVDIRGCKFSDDDDNKTIDFVLPSLADAIYDETTTYNGISFPKFFSEDLKNSR